MNPRRESLIVTITLWLLVVLMAYATYLAGKDWWSWHKFRAECAREHVMMGMGER